MKKTNFLIIAFLIIFSSCEDPYLHAPYVMLNETSETAAGIVPVNLSATHGEKQSITLSWDLVTNASLYYIYKADSPLDSFIRCAETSSNRITLDNVPPGSSVYYRVSSVSYNGAESVRSNYVFGTSLAQPVVSDITDISENSATVTWYMENVSGSTYKDNLLYTVYCFNGNVEVAQKVLDAALISENRAVFSGLNPNTRYEYQVEAYLRANQNNSEKSEKVDAATARRYRPGPPIGLKAARGTSVDKVELSFTLPDMVDIALGDNTFNPKPLYFTISKRLYSEGGNNEYQIICSYFGVNSNDLPSKITSYSPGTAVTWVDNNVDRGIEYEYQVKSYVDVENKIISSDSSLANATGWTLSEGEVSYGIPVYTRDEHAEFYKRAGLSFEFDFDHKGESYDYAVITKVDPINDDDPKDPDSFVMRREYHGFHDVSNYAMEMDLTQKSSHNSPGRGIYSFEIEVKLPGKTESIYTFKALGSIEISEDTQPIIVENFRVQDGYTNKFVFYWDNHQNRIYYIEESTDKNNWKAIATINPSASNDNEMFEQNFEFPIINQEPGVTKYFRIRPARPVSGGEPKNGQWVYAQAARTLGVPELSLSAEASYSHITPLWTEAQKADTYRIRYRYADEGAEFKVVANVKKEDLTVDASGRLRYSFRPEGYNDAQKAGKEIQIEVDALNKGLQATAGGGEISTSSTENVRTRLVGPANLNAEASKAASSQEISISWNSVAGAGGYYVFRRQFNMNNTAEEGTEAVVYYIPASASSSINVTGKNLTLDTSNSKVDSQTVKAAASFANSRYTLRDMYLPDGEYDSAAYNRHIQAYRDQQNDMAQGISYRYFVVPVLTNEPLNAIEFNYNKDGSNKHTSIASYKLVDINYTGAAALEKDGFTIGFGQNVTATKGTYASSGNTNNAIQITWSAPVRLNSEGFSPRYTVYRRESGSSSWSPVTNDNAATSYVDTTADAGKTYEYVIGINSANGGSIFTPQSSRRFIELCTAKRDEKNRPIMSGYKLGMVRMDSVSRGEDSSFNAQYGEMVKWHSAGVTSSYSTSNNWGIDGYEVFVMNRNISAGWHSINTMTNIPDQLSHSVLLTPNNTPSVTITDSLGTATRNLLFVLRDYKHYFKVRSYVMSGDDRIYSPDPPYTYTNGTASNPHFLETDYVKWGARQITQTEFAQITSLYMARAIEQGNYWTSTWAIVARTWRTVNAAANYGGGGNMRHSSNAAVTEWQYEYRNWKTDLQTRAGDWMTFISVDGDVWIVTGASTRPHRYRRANNGYKNNRLVVTGPSDTPHLYSGEVQFGANNADNNVNNLRWADGTVHVIYPSGTAIQTFSLRGQDTAFMFSTDVGGSSNYVNQGNAWR